MKSRGALMKNVFLIGSKGIPSNYGGFETFVDKLTLYKKSKDIMYHVSCLNVEEEEFSYNNARCFNVEVKDIGSAKAVLYDLQALSKSIKYIEENNLSNSIILILACRIGPFLPFYKKKLKDLGIRLYINPDGHEWKRSKWIAPIRAYWKVSEKLMVKHSDLQICDSKGIKEYYLIVGRFVPENNYEVMIREFMKSDVDKDLVIITNVEKNKFYDRLLKATQFTSDKRIKFVGTVYNNELLKKIREEATAYIHGHAVGGTNPSLLEALSSTDINLLFDVNFNKEVGRDGALYFNGGDGDLASLINKAEHLKENDIQKISKISTDIIINSY